MRQLRPRPVSLLKLLQHRASKTGESKKQSSARRAVVSVDLGTSSWTEQPLKVQKDHIRGLRRGLGHQETKGCFSLKLGIHKHTDC